MAEGGGHENPFDSNPLGRDNEGYGEEIPMSRTDHDLRPGGTPSGRFREHHDEEETSFGGGQTTPLISREEQQDEDWKELRSEYPEIPRRPNFLLRKDYYGRFELKSTRRSNNVWRLLYNPKTGELNKSFRKR